MSESLSRAAHRWIAGEDDLMVEVTLTPVQGGVIASRRTGVSHHLSDAVEITHNGDATIAGRWLCGGSSVDAVLLPDGDEIACVNCRLAAAMPQQPCVYFAWGADDELLCVGSSVKVHQRVRAHMTSTPWWHEVARLTFDEHDTEFAARRAEFEAIAERPGRYNKDGVRKPASAPALGFVIGEAE